MGSKKGRRGELTVGTSVGHGEDSWAGVFELEVLISELLSVDGNTSSSIAFGEVSTLAHEVGDHSVEARSLEVKALRAGALLSFANESEKLKANSPVHKALKFSAVLGTISALSCTT